MATILLVDDDAEVLATLASSARSAGHEVVTAASGTDALTLLDGPAPIDLMVTDVIMPGLNGFNLARMARLRRPSLRILYLTAYHEQVTTMQDGGERYGKLLLKPLSPADLRLEIERALAVPPG